MEETVTILITAGQAKRLADFLGHLTVASLPSDTAVLIWRLQKSLAVDGQTHIDQRALG
jgi:hypothetical protein